MDRRDEIDDEDFSEEDVEAEFFVTGDDLYLVMKALDVYAYALIISQSQTELELVKTLAVKILKNLPKAEFDA
jgi:hypothetical protein